MCVFVSSDCIYPMIDVFLDRRSTAVAARKTEKIEKIFFNAFKTEAGHIMNNIFLFKINHKLENVTL